MSVLSVSQLSKDIQLQLRATDHRDALEEVLFTLRSDHRVKDWAKLRASILSDSHPENFRECPGTMFLHHGRTESVSSLVLAVGRSATGLALGLGVASPRLIFVAAIPEAMNTEYLRILGAISRLCREEKSLDSLLHAENSESFLTALEKGCRQ